MSYKADLRIRRDGKTIRGVLLDVSDEQFRLLPFAIRDFCEKADKIIAESNVNVIRFPSDNVLRLPRDL